MNAVNEGQYYRATRPTAPVDPQTEMSEEEGSEMVGPSRVSPSDRQPWKGGGFGSMVEPRRTVNYSVALGMEKLIQNMNELSVL
jgi:hypothetical protein